MAGIHHPLPHGLGHLGDVPVGGVVEHENAGHGGVLQLWRVE